MSALADIEVTSHAASRYCERVAPSLSLIEAAVAIGRHRKAICTAAEFGCRFVKLGCGARLVLMGAIVVTVLGADQPPGRLMEWPA